MLEQTENYEYVLFSPPSEIIQHMLGGYAAFIRLTAASQTGNTHLHLQQNHKASGTYATSRSLHPTLSE